MTNALKRLTLILTLLLPAGEVAAAFDHSHAAFGTVLDQFVRDGRVDYAALKAAPTPLDAYLDQLAAVTEKEFMGFSDTQKVAFLINLYNASALKLVIAHYPISGIKDIGNWFRGPFDQKLVRLMGRTFTLGDIEHGILRRNHAGDPRFHLALVSASLGSPVLRKEPFRADDLDEQLDDQTRRFLSDKSKNFLDQRTRTLYLSKIFKWFDKDFIRKSESVIAFVLPYLPPEMAANIKAHPCTIEYTEYSWSLNGTGPTAASR